MRLTKFLITSIVIFLAGCKMPDHVGFYQPVTMNMKVPDGPVEYQAGWYGGCKSALGTRIFSNAFVYQQNIGAETVNGAYQHDPDFQAGWANGWFACALHTGTFVYYNSMRHGPLE